MCVPFSANYSPLRMQLLSSVLAGRPFVDEIFHELGCSIEWRVKVSLIYLKKVFVVVSANKYFCERETNASFGVFDEKNLLLFL